ncbi:CoA-binding protein [Roseomonas sp. CCTCC AB2023176]|uniref:CoA-binding protein n=1 Tax=Roseomonas sp. CCTCC AB2023176 TaxID=3342640 RepID=UPI0035E1F887
MPTDGLTDDQVREVLLKARRIAVVGASDKPNRPSHGVFRFLLDRGYSAIPVNPALDGRTVHGMASVPSLEEAGPLDLVDVFRRSEDVGPVVDEAIRLKAKAIWLQLGIWNHEAAGRARAAGIPIVMDRCPVIEWPRLGLPPRIPA